MTERKDDYRADGSAEKRAPMKGSGPVVCCGTHRARCLFGYPHAWGVWYEAGRLVRTEDTYHCWTCGGFCTAEEALGA